MIDEKFFYRLIFLNRYLSTTLSRTKGRGKIDDTGLTREQTEDLMQDWICTMIFVLDCYFE